MRPFLCLCVLAICVLTCSEAFADHSGVFSGRRIQRAKQGVSKAVGIPFRAVKNVSGKAVRAPFRVAGCVFRRCG